MFIFREEFLSAPIHSPLSGRLIGPSTTAASKEILSIRSIRVAATEENEKPKGFRRLSIS
jgi:hypothetical protein